MKKNRALRAVEFLEKAGPVGVHSFTLNNLLNTNFSPRAICEARKLGYDIHGQDEKLGEAWGVRYFLLAKNGTATFEETKKVVQKIQKKLEKVPAKPVRWEPFIDQYGEERMRAVYA